MAKLITLLGDSQVFRRVAPVFRELDPLVVAYLVFVDASALALAAVLIATGHRLGNIPALLVLVFLGVYGERSKIMLRSRFSASISLLPAIFAATLFGPLAAMLVYSVAAFGLAMPTAGRLTYAGSRALTGALAALGAGGVHHWMSAGTGRTILAAAFAALVAELGDGFFTATAFRLRRLGSIREALHDSVPVIAASVPFYSSAVAILALAYQHLSVWTLPLFFVPALAAQRWFLLYQEQRRLADDLQAANDQLRNANLSFAKGLIVTLDARDQYTAGHSAAVAIYARDIARRMGLAQDVQELAYLCGLVHDIGKIGLPAGLLEKPGALTLDERREMQKHSEIGERILATVDTYAEIASIVRHHHERVDGQGYPDGLQGTSIPQISRIIAVADAYNAMTSNRPYRDAMPSRVARLRLAQAVETQFDTSVVAAFEAVLAGATEDYRCARSDTFHLIGESAPGDSELAAVAASG